MGRRRGGGIKGVEKCGGKEHLQVWGLTDASKDMVYLGCWNLVTSSMMFASCNIRSSPWQHAHRYSHSLPLTASDS